MNLLTHNWTEKIWKALSTYILKNFQKVRYGLYSNSLIFRLTSF